MAAKVVGLGGGRASTTHYPSVDLERETSMSCGACGEGKSNNTKGEGERERERERETEEHNNTLNDSITGFRVLALQNTRPFGAAISRARGRQASGKGRLEVESISYMEHVIRKLKNSALHPMHNGGSAFLVHFWIESQ